MSMSCAFHDASFGNGLLLRGDHCSSFITHRNRRGRGKEEMSLNADFMTYGPALVPFALLWHTSHNVRLWHGEKFTPDRHSQSIPHTTSTHHKLVHEDCGREPGSNSGGGNRLRMLYTSPVWSIITGLTCNVADAQSAREFITAWLKSKESLDPYNEYDAYRMESPDTYASSPAPTTDRENAGQLSELDQTLISKLRQRAKAVEEGAGKLFRVRTQVGFLNVHSEPGDPHRTDNVVAQVTEGEIVQSTGPPSGDWEQHSGGGWSVRSYGGFVWLEPIDL